MGVQGAVLSAWGFYPHPPYFTQAATAATQTLTHKAKRRQQAGVFVQGERTRGAVTPSPPRALP